VQNSGTTEALHGLAFVGLESGTVVGSNGTILRTTNGGDTWVTQTSGTSSPLFDVCFADENHGAAVGAKGIILHTTDGGSTWTQQASGTNLELSGVAFTDREKGTVVGLQGTILRTTTGGTTDIEAIPGDPNVVPEQFVLEQNFPNPFNPTTTIGYTVGVMRRLPRAVQRGQSSVVSGQWSVASWVRLAVYDLLGRKVAALVDGQKEPGSYDVRFDGSHLASGVYFYRMQAGDFVQARKCLLVR